MNWVGFDLDGCLAKHESGDGVDKIGDPILPVVILLKEEAKNYEVRIMTARVCSLMGVEEIRKQTRMIQDWCEVFIGFRPRVTSEKDYEMIRLYDDRARQVQTNTGRLIE